MVGRVLSLYLRAGVGVANLALRTAARGAELAIDAVRIVAPSPGGAGHRESEDVFRAPAQPARTASESPRSETEARVEVTERPPAIDYESEPPTPIDEATEKAKSIDDEPEVVAEFAEPGAENGASAEIEVDEPWDGYDELAADEIAERIGDADAAALAVIGLYEQSHKQRRTVLTAVERRQRELANAPS